MGTGQGRRLPAPCFCAHLSSLRARSWLPTSLEGADHFASFVIRHSSYSTFSAHPLNLYSLHQAPLPISRWLFLRIPSVWPLPRRRRGGRIDGSDVFLCSSQPTIYWCRSHLSQLVNTSRICYLLLTRPRGRVDTLLTQDFPGMPPLIPQYYDVTALIRMSGQRLALLTPKVSSLSGQAAWVWIGQA